MQALLGALGKLLGAAVGWVPYIAAFVLGGKRAKSKVREQAQDDKIEILEERNRVEDWADRASDDELDKWL